MDLRLDDGSNWVFLGGQWSEDGDGVIQPPTISTHRGARAYDGQRATNADGFLAFCTGAMYSDFEAEFEFRWDSRVIAVYFLRSPRLCGEIFRTAN